MKPFLQVVVFFAITQIIALYSGAVLTNEARVNEDILNFSVSPMQNANDPMNAAIFIVYIVFGAVAMILLARYYKGMMLFKLLETMIIFSASTIVFFTVCMGMLGMDFVTALIIGSALALLLAAAKFVNAGAKNVAAVISSAGVGALFGFSLGFVPMVLFIILLSIYDYIAVFKTKHMIEMARELSTRQLSFAVTAKNIPKRLPREKTEVYVERAMRDGERLDLGTGDLSVPAMISVSAYALGPNGLIYAIAVAIGSTVSLFFLLKFVSDRRVFLPALPPICLGGMLALLLVKLAGF